MFCFSSLALYLVCCPDREVLSPEQAGCPDEYLNTECCSHSDFLTVVRDLRSNDYEESQNLLWKFLRDVDLSNSEAWYLYSTGFARNINLKTSEFLASVDKRSLREARDGATQLSRLVSKGMLRLESFQQFCLWQTATRSGRQVLNVQPGECERDVLSLYKETVANHDLLAYQLIPSLAYLPQLQLPDVSSIVVTLQIACVGKWARQGIGTLLSILHRRSTLLRIFVLGDAEGWEELHKALQEALPSELELTGVGFEHINFEEMPQFRTYMPLGRMMFVLIHRCATY